MHTKSFLSVFPQEIIDAIIMDSELDLETLASCSLVCRAFLRASQAVIFEYLDASEPEPSTSIPFHHLRDVLSQSPHLIRHIKNLRICFSLYTQIPTTLVSVIELLSNVHSFALERVHWPSLTQNAKVAICDLCRRSRLSMLKLDGVQGLDSATVLQLTVSPCLRELGLLSIRLTSGDETGRNHNPSATSEADSDLFPSLSGHIQGRAPSNLRHLQVQLDVKNLSFWQSIVDSSATSLQVVALNAAYIFSSPGSRCFSLAGLTSLRSLTLFIPLRSESFIPWVSEVIQSNNSAHLTEIRIEMLPLSDAVPPTDWDRLAQLLEGARFPALQVLQLNLWDFGDPPELMRTLETAAHQAFSRRNARGIFECAVREIELEAGEENA
ncbi:hypothetical protein C8R47DRAFT_1147988 [Mycena vitilis]|nr:hypothetical protein C8R47DRAFT_1147988 [Mycena vitilis]